jgi:Predicted transcriptional regulators
MEPGKLAVEVEVGPRFEIFYALHKMFAPPTPIVERWRKSARSRAGTRLIGEARSVAPEPLMWAILADSTLGTRSVRSFEDLIAAIEEQSPARFHSNVIGGVPAARGSDLVATFESLLHDPEDYRSRLVAVLRAFWSRAFADDFAAMLPELNRMARQLSSAAANAPAADVGGILGIPISVDEDGDTLTAGRGYTIPRARAGRVLLLPSAFNLNRWWTKRDDGERPVDFYFPVNDGTVSPSDAQSSPKHAASAAARDETLHPEIVFRALGDTTRYAIATILARSPATPTELSRQLKVSKPTITHHLHALRDAGLILEGAGGGKLGLDRTRLERLSEAAVSTLFAPGGKLKLSKTRKKIR